MAPLGPHWKRMWRTCMEHLLTTKRLDSFSGHRASEMCHLVRDVASAEGAVNLREILGGFSMNNVTRMLPRKQFFGPELVGPIEAAEFMRLAHELFSLLGMIYLGDYLPLWRWFDLFGCEKKMREVEKKIDKFHQNIIDEH
ncbi:Cytochrome P450 [Canna indica]|uniref:Cytochrome P450 n=1 Tax=Canna indica TaxID=4628 RepID=A0AAQ3KXD0_9LILI|nr:Cytochrome P450 [Canna indica]